jgi:hypothetical protein
MKKIFDIRHIVIVLLLLLAVVEFLNPNGIMPNRTKTIRDTVGIEVPVHDTIEVEVPYEVEVEVPVEVEKRVEVLVQTPVDTSEILKVYFAKTTYNDVIKLPNDIGSVTITDSISKNTVVNRKFVADVKKFIVKDTIYTQEPFKRKVFFGLEGGFNSADFVNFIGAGVLINSKSDKIYNLGVGVNNTTTDGTNGVFTPYIKGGVYWKIKLRK